MRAIRIDTKGVLYRRAVLQARIFPTGFEKDLEGFAFGTTMYGGFAPDQFAILSLMLLLIVALVSLYPAWYAARMEPVEALHSL